MTEDKISQHSMPAIVKWPLYIKIFTVLLPLFPLMVILGISIMYAIPELNAHYILSAELSFNVYCIFISTLPIGLTGLFLYIAYSVMHWHRITVLGILVRLLGVLLSVSCILGFFMIMRVLSGKGFQ